MKERKNRKFPNVPEETRQSEELADVSLYGEFVPNFHHWVSFENMEKRTKYMEAIGKGKDVKPSDIRDDKT